MAGDDLARDGPIGTLAHARREDHEALRARLTATYDIRRGPLIAFFDGRLTNFDDPPWHAEASAILCLATIQGATILPRSDREAQAIDQSIDGPPKLPKGALGDA